MLELLEHDFFIHALIGAFLVSIACGIMGSLIMVNRLLSMAGGITHAAFGGIGIAFYFGIPILLSTSIFTLILAILVAYLTKKYEKRSDNIIAVIWALGMAVGIILIDLSSGYSSDLMSYLFGSILGISQYDLYLMGIIDFIFLVLIVVFYRQFEAVSFDSQFAKLKGVSTDFFHYLLVIMIAFCIVITIRTVGLILVIALLSIPCFIAEQFTKRLGSMMALSAILSMFFCLVGLLLSYFLNLSSGASIILVASLGFFLSIFKKLTIFHK